MKKRVLSLLLSATLVIGSLSVFAGCGDGNNETPTDPQSEETTQSTQTDAVTDEPTAEESTTDASSENVPTEPPTEAPTQETTETPTENITETETETTTETETETETETNTETSTDAPTEAPTETESETEETTEAPTEPDLDSIIYDNGASVMDSGADWPDNAFASTENTIDEANATEISASEFVTMLENGSLQSGAVYKVADIIKLNGNTSYNGNLSALIAEGGIAIENTNSVSLEKLIIKGNLSIKNSSAITILNIDLKGGETALDIDGKSEDIIISESRITAHNIAIKNDASLLSVYKCYVSADCGIKSSGSDLTVQDCKISAVSVAVTSSGRYAIVRENDVTFAADGIGIEFTEGSYNGLIALNVIKDGQKSIKVCGGYNCSVVLNSAIRIIAEDNTNIYAVDNTLGGAIELRNNKYLICDGNRFKNDKKEHYVISTGNSEINGSNVTDVDERLEYGANEELLPHTNKDLFLDMERRKHVIDLTRTQNQTLNQYINNAASDGIYIVVAPGSYSIDSAITITQSHDQKSIYAYGVLAEATFQRNGVIQIVRAAQVEIKGITFGFNIQSAGQVYVLEKLSGNRVRVIANAGYDEDFANSGDSQFRGGTHYAYSVGEFSPWVEGYHKFVEKCDDGSMIYEIMGADPNGKDSSSYSAYWKLTNPGDVWGCRLSGENTRTIYVENSHDIKMSDCVVYSHAVALGIVGVGNIYGIELERYHNTARSAFVIDEETYNRYKALEEQYGIDLEVYIDEQGRYRGGIPRIGSVDASHISSVRQGVSMTSCLLENMCDDGSNQRGSSSRLAGIVDNKDGTTTVYYKGCLGETYFYLHTNANQSTGSLSQIVQPGEGNRVYAYASNGKILFDTEILSSATMVANADKVIHLVHVDDVDNDGECDDGFCDVCHKVVHYDDNRDGFCDKCGYKVHVDTDKNGRCDISGCGKTLTDENSDSICDSDSLPIINNRFGNESYNSTTGKLTYQSAYSNTTGLHLIQYSTVIYKFTVKTSDVNFDALEGYDLTDNNCAMTHKILVDNLSYNSGNFTIDNTMVRNSHARGIVPKTTDVTIKHCTFRNLGAAGVLMSVETTWNESTTSQNINILNCLFDNTSGNYTARTDYKRAPIAIQGLGEYSSKLSVTAGSLPCRNIRIEGNRFSNMVEPAFYITISAAQNVTIKNNIFDQRPTETKTRIGKAIYINGAINVEISGNTYSSFAEGNMNKVVVASNYIGLTGSDVEGILPKDNIK